MMKLNFTFLGLVMSISSYGQVENIKLIFFDGLYETKCYFEKGDEEGHQDYLRFYPNGKVIAVGTDCDGSALELKDWFNINAEQVGIGDYIINKRKIKFSTKSKTGTVIYNGRIVKHESIKIKWRSQINGTRGRGKYTFVRVTGLS